MFLLSKWCKIISKRLTVDTISNKAEEIKTKMISRKYVGSMQNPAQLKGWDIPTFKFRVIVYHVCVQLSNPLAASVKVWTVDLLLTNFLLTFDINLNLIMEQKCCLVNNWTEAGKSLKVGFDMVKRTTHARRRWIITGYYRKRGSASYIVREVLSVRERDTERQRETEVTSPLSR